MRVCDRCQEKESAAQWDRDALDARRYNFGATVFEADPTADFDLCHPCEESLKDFLAGAPVPRTASQDAQSGRERVSRTEGD